MKSDKDGLPVEKNPFKCRFCRIQVANPDLWYPDKNLKSVSVLIHNLTKPFSVLGHQYLHDWKKSWKLPKG
jgi:hypothetical protein